MGMKHKRESEPVVIEVVGLNAEQEAELLAWAEELIDRGEAEWVEHVPPSEDLQ